MLNCLVLEQYAIFGSLVLKELIDTRSRFPGKLRLLTVQGFLGRLLQVIPELVIEFLTDADVLEHPL